MSFGRPKKYLYTKELLFSLAHCASHLFRALWVLFTGERAGRIQAGFGPDTAISVLSAVWRRLIKEQLQDTFD